MKISAIFSQEASDDPEEMRRLFDFLKNAGAESLFRLELTNSVAADMSPGLFSSVEARFPSLKREIVTSGQLES